MWKEIQWKFIIDQHTFQPGWKLQIGERMFLPFVTLMPSDAKTDHDMAVMKAELESTHPEFLESRTLELKIAMLKYQNLLLGIHAAEKIESYCPYTELQK